MADVTLQDSMYGTYASFSGTDILAVMSVPVIQKGAKGPIYYDVPFGTIQTLTISTHREKYPVRALGFINARGFSYGMRTISGTMIFTLFDKDAIYEAAQLVANGSIPENSNSIVMNPSVTEIYTNMLADEMPRFNILINMGNEYGSMSNMAIFGVTIVDMGQVMSVDDIMTEQTMSYMATGLRKLQPGAFKYITPTSDFSPLPIDNKPKTGRKNNQITI